MEVKAAVSRADAPPALYPHHRSQQSGKASQGSHSSNSDQYGGSDSTKKVLDSSRDDELLLFSPEVLEQVLPFLSVVWLYLPLSGGRIFAVLPRGHSRSGHGGDYSELRWR